MQGAKRQNATSGTSQVDSKGLQALYLNSPHNSTLLDFVNFKKLNFKI